MEAGSIVQAIALTNGKAKAIFVTVSVESGRRLSQTQHYPCRLKCVRCKSRDHFLKEPAFETKDSTAHGITVACFCCGCARYGGSCLFHRQTAAR